MVSSVTSLGISGIKGFYVSVQCYIGPGGPAFDVVGLPDAAVREARDRVRAAIRSLGRDFPDGRITVNLAPAFLKKEGSVYDLPILLSILCADGQIPMLNPDHAFIGELSLDAKVCVTHGMLPMSLAAAQNGLHTLFCPADCAYEATLADNLTVYPVSRVEDLIDHLRGVRPIPAQSRWTPPPADPNAPHLDLADVQGQYLAKRALEIAAAGGHHLILTGPPGVGKSMLAQRIISILPPLTHSEALETTSVYSVAGILDPNRPLISERPFRAPHHSTSIGGLAGGGRIPKPGELSLAHNGVLFLDELPEFAADALEVLRQPIETGEITLARVNGTLTYPCRFMLVAAMNPCKCGYHGSPFHPCTCSEESVRRYREKISGPLLDRIDLHVNVPQLRFDEMHGPTPEHSASIRARVCAARERQVARFRDYPGVYCNAQMTPKMVRSMIRLEPEVEEHLRMLYDRLHMSGRAHDRVLRVASTIADLEARPERITVKDIEDAVNFRAEFK